MSFARPERERRRTTPLTALIDILFILIIFFVTTNSFRAEEHQIDVDLVATETGESVEPTRTEIVINIKADGTVTIGERSFNREELRALLARLVKDYPNERVIVRGDRDARYEDVLMVIDVARSLDITNISMATVVQQEE